MKIIILSTLLLLFLLMTAAIYLCIFYEVIRYMILEDWQKFSMK